MNRTKFFVLLKFGEFCFFEVSFSEFFSTFKKKNSPQNPTLLPVRCVLASVLVAMKWHPGFSEMHSVAYWIL